MRTNRLKCRHRATLAKILATIEGSTFTICDAYDAGEVGDLTLMEAHLRVVRHNLAQADAQLLRLIAACDPELLRLLRGVRPDLRRRRRTAAKV